jgi:hypothetical protein
MRPIWRRPFMILRICGGALCLANYDYATAGRLSRVGPSTVLLRVSCLLPASFAWVFSRLVRISPAEILQFLCA